MGVNSEAILVYGWVFSCEEFRRLIIPFMKKNGIEYNDPGEDSCLFLEFCDKFEDVIKEKYPDMKTGSASPYYDCYPNENTFYISFRDVTDVKSLVLDMQSDYPSSGTETDCIKLQKDLDLIEPTIEALANIY